MSKLNYLLRDYPDLFSEIKKLTSKELNEYLKKDNEFYNQRI